MFIYLILNEATGEYKIGKSKHPGKRVLELQTASPGKLRLEATFKSVKPFELETYMKAFFKDSHVSGEWFYTGIIDISLFLDRCSHFESFIKLRVAEDEW